MGKKKHSIIQDLNDCRCFNCGSGYGLELHHCLFGSGKRKLADEDGLTVWLCHRCHKALHESRPELARELKEKAEMAWIAHGDSDIEGFIERYGMNYLEIKI